jgi:hypothetical protein
MYREGASVYRIRWQWQLTGLATALFPVGLFIWAWIDLGSPDKGMAVLTVIFVPMGFCVTRGIVTTTQAGIRKNGVWRSQCFQWGEITGIRLHEKQGGAVELRSHGRKMVIDALRLNAYQHLLQEIEARSHLRRTEWLEATTGNVSPQ